jgi:hypothetical protein
MKTFYLLLFILLLNKGLVNAQQPPAFNLTKDGVKPVVLNFDASYTSNLIYTRIKEWIVITYKFPKSVTRIDTENQLVKVGSVKEKAWKIRSNDIDYWNDLEYTLTIEIKEGKCRVTFDTKDGRWKVWYNKDGSLIKKFKDSEATFEASINELLGSLNKYIKNGPPKPVKDEW